MPQRDGMGTGGVATIEHLRTTKFSTYYSWKLLNEQVEVRVSTTSKQTNVVCMTDHSVLCVHAVDVAEFIKEK